MLTVCCVVYLLYTVLYILLYSVVSLSIVKERERPVFV